MLCLNGQILLLTGANTQEELREKTMRIHTEFTEFVETEFGCSLISGVSQVFPGLKYLRTAYNECMETLKNTGSGPRDHSDITFYEEIARNDGIISGYDYVMENALTKAVNDGDCEEAAQLVDKFINSLNNRGITRHDRNFFLYRLVIAVLAVLSDAGLSANQVFRDRSEDIFQKLNYICESDKLKSYMNSQIVQPSIEALRQYRYQASSEILRRIMELVHERRGDITLTECAEQLNYHPSYIWKILKAERNMTFTDLVNLEKLETAKELLLNTELSIAEISEQLSYANTQNFIRFFSKYVDSTPGKYRKEHKGQEDKSRL
ncbi:MAG: helix-turn-helix transcriptional regulator [Eisenbergiella massiliensis]